MAQTGTQRSRSAGVKGSVPGHLHREAGRRGGGGAWGGDGEEDPEKWGKCSLAV